MISKMKATKFPHVTDNDWQEVAIKSLRGLPFEKLMTKTLEGIEIAPLYTKEYIERHLHQHETMLETIRSGTKSSDWTIAQQSYATDGEQYINELIESLEKGNEAIVMDGRRFISWQEEQLNKLKELIQTYPIYAFNMKEDHPFIQLLSKIDENDREKVKGAIIGKITIPKGYTHVRTIVADTTPYHYKGADIVTELALTIAKAVEEVENFPNFTELTNRFIVRFQVDTHFFMEIAKIRAFRLLWQTLAQSYGVKEQVSVPVFSETSLRTYSKLDPYVNLLRAGNEAFSAVIGGTDILTVHPHNILAEVTPTSARIARNVQLVIKEETFVNQILDPAGGSYYIDSLTDELTKKAWALFVEIEANGGFTSYVESDLFQEKLNRLYEERVKQLSVHQTSLIGTNIYADLTNPFEQEEATVEVENRLAEPYEQLRAYFERHQPKVMLLNFGELKDFKPRADFVTGFLAAGGIKAEWSPAFHTAKEGQKWINENEFDYGVICADGKEIETIMEELMQDFPRNKQIDVAGSYDTSLEEKWKNAGIKGFIFKGQNQLEKLTMLKSLFTKEGRK